MAIQLLNLPQARIQDPGLDASPLVTALRAYTAGNDAATQHANQKQVGQLAATGDLRAAARQAMGLGETELGMQYRQGAQQDEALLRKRLGSMAQAVEMEQDPGRRQAMWQRVLKMVPGGAQSLAPDEMDPMTGPKMLMAESGIVIDPLERQQRQAQLQVSNLDAAIKRRELASPQGKLTELDPNKRLIYTDPRTGETRMIMDAQGGGASFGPFKGAKEKADVEQGLRKEYATLAKPYFEVRDAYSRVEQAAAKPSAAGDLALIFNFMKMLDPGSVVREGEFATAQSAGSVPDRVWGLYNRIIQGERLSDPIRADFVAQSRGLYDRAAAQYQGIQRNYHGIATRTGADPQNTIVDFNPPVAGGSPPTQGAARSFDDVNQIPEGAKFKDETTGRVYQKRGGQIVTVQ